MCSVKYPIKPKFYIINNTNIPEAAVGNATYYNIGSEDNYFYVFEKDLSVGTYVYQCQAELHNQPVVLSNTVNFQVIGEIICSYKCFVI